MNNFDTQSRARATGPKRERKMTNAAKMDDAVVTDARAAYEAAEIAARREFDAKMRLPNQLRADSDSAEIDWLYHAAQTVANREYEVAMARARCRYEIALKRARRYYITQSQI